MAVIVLVFASKYGVHCHNKKIYLCMLVSWCPPRDRSNLNGVIQLYVLDIQKVSQKQFSIQIKGKPVASSHTRPSHTPLLQLYFDQGNVSEGMPSGSFRASHLIKSSFSGSLILNSFQSTRHVTALVVLAYLHAFYLHVVSAHLTFSKLDNKNQFLKVFPFFQTQIEMF